MGNEGFSDEERVGSGYGVHLVIVTAAHSGEGHEFVHQCSYIVSFDEEDAVPFCDTRPGVCCGELVSIHWAWDEWCLFEDLFSCDRLDQCELHADAFDADEDGFSVHFGCSDDEFRCFRPFGFDSDYVCYAEASGRELCYLSADGIVPGAFGRCSEIPIAHPSHVLWFFGDCFEPFSFKDVSFREGWNALEHSSEDMGVMGFDGFYEFRCETWC